MYQHWIIYSLKQILTELTGEINSNIIIIGDFNTPLFSTMEK